MEPEASVRDLDGRARRLETGLPGGGRMVWRVWGDGPALVLLHGGYGSWLHWSRNIGDLSRDFTIVAPDMPGFGDSDRAEEPVTVDLMAGIIVSGLRGVLGEGARYRIVGFSFGSVIGGHMPRVAGDALDQLIVVGFNRVGLWKLRRPPMVNWREARTPEELEAAQRHNLGSLMFYDKARIDDLSIHLQTVNTARARVRSLDIAQSHDLPARLEEVHAPVAGIWGEHDVTLLTGADDVVRAMRGHVPDADCVVIPGAGHWVQYEAADEFNTTVRAVVGRAEAKA